MRIRDTDFTTSIGQGFLSDETDVKKARRLFKTIGYESGEEDFGYPDKKLEGAIRNFQRDNKLKEDGIMHPDGETKTKLNQKIAEKERNDKYYKRYEKKSGYPIKLKQKDFNEHKVYKDAMNINKKRFEDSMIKGTVKNRKGQEEPHIFKDQILSLKDGESKALVMPNTPAGDRLLGS